MEPQQVAHDLSQTAYDQYAEGVETRLAKATTEYVGALQSAALDFAGNHPALNAADFMLAYHDNLSNDLHAV